jgi:hypothetical protein
LGCITIINRISKKKEMLMKKFFKKLWNCVRGKGWTDCPDIEMESPPASNVEDSVNADTQDSSNSSAKDSEESGWSCSKFFRKLFAYGSGALSLAVCFFLIYSPEAGIVSIVLGTASLPLLFVLNGENVDGLFIAVRDAFNQQRELGCGVGRSICKTIGSFVTWENAIFLPLGVVSGLTNSYLSFTKITVRGFNVVCGVFGLLVPAVVNVGGIKGMLRKASCGKWFAEKTEADVQALIDSKGLKKLSTLQLRKILNEIKHFNDKKTRVSSEATALLSENVENGLDQAEQILGFIKQELLKAADRSCCPAFTQILCGTLGVIAGGVSQAFTAPLGYEASEAIFGPGSANWILGAGTCVFQAGMTMFAGYSVLSELGDLLTSLINGFACGKITNDSGCAAFGKSLYSVLVLGLGFTGSLPNLANTRNTFPDVTGFFAGLLNTCALAAPWCMQTYAGTELVSPHPVATTLVNACNKSGVRIEELPDVVENEEPEHVTPAFR